MDEVIERLVVQVRADTQGLARDVGEMRAMLDAPLAAGAASAGRAIEGALLRAVRTGRFGFEELRGVALRVLDDIAAAAIRTGIGALLGGGGGAGGILGGLLGSLLGAPGRATGGAVSPGRPYWVGERGPELFVPASAGGIAAAPAGGGVRELRVAITVNAPGGEAPRALAQSSRQVARAVKAALERLD
ncbi:tail tape measure protein [Sphingomonas canadensis]|uniref:Tail tape measure protein n=1 Tax=Sphingomonas canadensis TaxID=1219257 RepID=A0ABW3H327_9SPHN|nr:tail tape measure protein [Sphingomonas canadensis]MCW3834506.1 tail tape measure protein [Sphingomonas canadensis]